MMSAINVSPKQAASYYYAEDAMETPGQWFGKGADALNLTGTVHLKDFRDVLYGNSPAKFFRLRQKRKSYQATPAHGRTIQTMERAATDLTFSAPKSVSIAALVYEDHRIIEAHQNAVATVLNTIQDNHLRTRAKVNGKRRKVTTDNMVAATFLHKTSRNQDPQLHTHCLVMNTTQGPDGKWRAMDNTEFFDHHRVALSIQYRQQLARNLQALNYKIAWGQSHCFEIASIHPALIEEFSSRRKQVLESTADTSSKARQNATLITRPPKEHHLQLGLQVAIWRQQARNVLEDFKRQQKQQQLAQQTALPQSPGEVSQPTEEPQRQRRYIPPIAANPQRRRGPRR